MRPDEHKKKKNTAYKKKHGITTEPSDSKEEKTKRDAAKASRDRKNEPPSKSYQATSKINDLSSSKILVTDGASFPGARSETKIKNKHPDSSSSEDEAESSVKKKAFKSFRRREIVSNWQKYELQPNEQESTPRGENYEKLLSMAGETLSHFRFKDELAWDDPADSANEKSSDAYDQFLCVNPVELAHSLACLPVYQVLGVSQHVFPDDQLSSMAITTKDRQSAYAAEELLDVKGQEMSRAGKDAFIEDPYPPRHVSTHKDDDKKLPSVIKLKVQSSKLSDTPKQRIDNTSTSLSAPDATVKAHDNRSGSDIVSKEVFSSDSSNFLVKKLNEKLQLKDEDLDTLLDCENPTAQLTGDTIGTSENEPSSPDSGPNCDTSSTPIEPSTEGLASKMVAESSDLEDWLDSILDD